MPLGTPRLVEYDDVGEPSFETELSPDVVAWITCMVGGGTARVNRFGHHRPMWTVDVVRPERTVELFVRGARDSGSVLASVYNLEREAAVIQALTSLGVPTPPFVGFHPGEQVLVLERVPGRSDFHHIVDTHQRKRIARRFVEVLCDLHRRDPADFGLRADMRVPVTPHEHALGELEIAEPLYDAAELSPEPVISLGRRWLRGNVPGAVDHTCFVQGDTGPGNFVFDGDDVWLVDLEISHFGDPMEDLAAVCVRDMVTPFADLRSLFRWYQSMAAWRMDLDRVRYHRVSKCVRSLMAIVSLAELGQDGRERSTWWAYRALYVRGACQALAEAMGLRFADLRDPSILQATDPSDPALGQAEEAALEQLLGVSVATDEEGLRRLDRCIQSGGARADDVDLLRFLTARADRQCLLARPAMGAMADGRFSPIG
jgi:aminoglycoside phosphotransferase (APT) family kinase protein